jgi:hypothetical protein
VLDVLEAQVGLQGVGVVLPIVCCFDRV